MSAIRLGISTCPNDTFAFHAILERRIDLGDLEFAIDLLDVEELNRGLLEQRFDVAKVSFATVLAAAADVVVLRSGSALGFGVGPVVLARRDARLPPAPRVLCPGEHTTAHLLYRLFHPGPGTIHHARFSDIMPALVRGDADLGVCIHEGRFTYADHGLDLVEDLGVTWESLTKTPLPLGGVVARRSLAPNLVARVQDTIQRSLDYAHAHRQETLVTMRRHAQEHNDCVLWQHVDLYVNPWTRDLGDQGRRALAELARRAKVAGVGEGRIMILE